MKQMLAYRAKYRKHSPDEGYPMISPSLIIPHPDNRSGDPVRSLRTMELFSMIAADGCDVFEASAGAVCVEEHPDQEKRHGNARWQSFQHNYEKQIAADPHMAKRVNGVIAAFASLSHSHFNCLLRNVVTGQKGCECNGKEGGGERQCKNRALFDEQGRYNVERLEKHDPAWAGLCWRGMRWEVLSYKLDVEEPLGAKIISLALNKRNDAAMATTHTEILTTLVGLCKPSPHGLDGQVPFEPVRDQMMEWYGAAVDHADFLYAFRLVMDAGGHESPHMQDLQQFTTIFVNPKVRKMSFDIYGVVAKYPPHFPKIKNACIKWAYQQDTQRGWCPLPPNISKLLEEGGKRSLHREMLDIEHTFREMSKCALAVVGQGDAKKRTTFIAKVEVGVMRKIFALKSSEADPGPKLEEECVQFLAPKLLELVDGDKHRIQELWQRTVGGNGNNILEKSFRTAVKDDFVPPKKPQRVQASETKGKTSAVAEAMVPTVTKQDKDGAPLIDDAPPPLPGVKQPEPETKIVTEVIAWERWITSRCQEEQLAVAKSVLGAACRSLNASIPNPKIAMVRKTNADTLRSKVHIQASVDLDVGHLVIPLQFRKANSLIGPNDTDKIHPHAVEAKVAWPVSEDDKRAGIEEDTEDC